MSSSEMESTSTSTPSTKELFEDIIHIVMSTPSTALFLLSHPLFSKLIIGASLVWITQSLICICNLLKLDLGPLWIILVLIWMVLDSQLLELLLDLCICGVSLHSKKFVVIFSLLLGLLLLALSLLSAAKAATEATPSEATIKTTLPLSLVLPLS